ncbi:hypothetical protein YK48G_24420 [Lentilactobacillus fungorum]|uniref:Peptidase metallopeptidase domain-containing protein n=1 Tax=Lentilactobacillus fungorum TaxID=2201250 RepID=A0ABQ3W3U2_9LACO|nr:matrixin family metalloprotease [Lentilactobacillus fungorum]GHP15017.1 hypothetical protein YK48G_24420 [Lentilactobacillus fungorum]
MKWFNRLIATAVILLTVNIFVQPNALTTIGRQVNNAVDIPAMLIGRLKKAATITQSPATTQARNETPIESIVNKRKLSNHYRYRFAKNVPAKAKQVFLTAVAKYNHTGIVKLSPASQKTSAQTNEITFYVYRKRISAQSSAIELGLGGPKIYPLLGYHADDLNRGKAGLNIEYPQSSIQLSVAMHEIGHALGLDHSLDRNSIMFPVDQGKTKLSAGDLAALREIYQN